MSSERGKIFRGFLSLGAVNTASMALPFLLVPILIRRLGPESYGEFALYTYCCLLCSTLVDFGLSISSVASVGKRIGQKRPHVDIFFAVGIIRVVIALGLTGILLLLSLLVGESGWIDVRLAISVFLASVTVGFRTWWYFQATSTTHQILLSELISKVAVFCTAVTFVSGPEDSSIFPFTSALFGLVTIAYQGFLACRESEARPSTRRLLRVAAVELVQSRKIVIGRSAILLYTLTAPLLIQIHLGPSLVTAYSLSDKILQALRMPLDILSGVIYSRAAVSYEKNAIRRYIRSNILIGLGLSALSVLITPFALKATRLQSDLYLIALLPAIALPAIAASGIIGNSVLLRNKKQTQYARSLYCGAAVFGLFAIYGIFSGNTNLAQILVAVAMVEWIIFLHRWKTALKHHLL